MSKNIVLCSDGTANSGGKGNGTNVWRIYQALDLTQNGKEGRQIAFHDDGVGTQDSKWLKLVCGATGFGLKRNIRQLYLFLCRNYELGDKIFLFGFSRGAYTVRALAGLITKCGIIDKAKYNSETELHDLAKKALKIYRGNYQREKKREKSLVEAETFIKTNAVIDNTHAVAGKVNIHFVGAWDTVDAYGLPWDGLTDVLDLIYPFKFKDRTLSDQVIQGAHAIAIDDQRHTFHPVLWDEKEETDGRINQVWFAGMHSNVGGGYPKDGMAMVTLDWMMTEAEKAGLVFFPQKRDEATNQANALAKMYDSRSGLAVYYRFLPRDLQCICSDHGIEKPNLHISVVQRLKAAVNGYAPGNLPATLEIVDTRNDSPHPSLPQWNQQMGSVSPNQPLLHAASTTIAVRSWLHKCLALISTGGLVYLIYNLFHLFKDGTIPRDSLMALFKWAFKYLITNPVPYVLFVTAMVIYFLGLWARKKMEKVFANFWFGKRPV